MFFLASYSPPIRHRYLHVCVAQPRKREGSYECDSGKHEPCGHKQIVFSAESESGHEHYDYRMPKICRKREACDDVEKMVIEPLSYVSCAWRQEHKQGYGNSRKREPVRTVQSSIVEVAGISDNPEKREKPYGDAQKTDIIPTGMGSLMFFLPYKHS